MKKLFAFALIGLCVACCPKESKTPQAFDYEPDFKALKVDKARLACIDTLLQGLVDDGSLPHALTFVAKDGQVIHNKAYGWRDVENGVALQRDDIFRMYSQTKAVMTVALMTLFEQGKFLLDDPVSKYIPEMTDQVVDKWINDSTCTTRQAASPVLIRHLLCHSSGINQGRRPISEKEFLADYVRELVARPLLFDPGTDWNYHTASDVAAYLVEYFSGKPLQEYLSEAVFEPLGITDMAYYYEPQYEERFVNIYKPDETGKLQKADFWSGRYPFGDQRTYAAGGTGLNGTIEGYARFCQMIANYGEFNCRRILGRRTVEVMGENYLPHPNSGGANFSYGLGFEVYSGVDAASGYIHPRSPMPTKGSLSWGGWANTDYLIDHKEGLIVLIYTNRVPDVKVWEAFLNTVYQSLE